MDNYINQYLSDKLLFFNDQLSDPTIGAPLWEYKLGKGSEPMRNIGSIQPPYSELFEFTQKDSLTHFSLPEASATTALANSPPGKLPKGSSHLMPNGTSEPETVIRRKEP